ncbi:MAG TPA: SDR family NAD(P)-dependent oxidoreductase [Nitrososphaerales archaeon]|nr:SDR family NAD(P)-dependent oxidoreductase [Nitrososphaerales archaeon]
MKALVTGGAGFIGSHLVDRLLKDGYQVTAMDNLTEGTLKNLAHLTNEKKFQFVEADLKDAKAMGKLVNGNDVVFHMAAHANIRKSLVDHRVDLENNLIGTLNLLEGMARHGVNDMVFASSSAVYGEAAVTPTPEDYTPVQTSLYGASKLACEAYAQSFTKFTPIRFWAYRFANVVGERCRRGVVWDFVHKLKRNPGELEILGDGRQSKEYLYVEDCVDGMMTGYAKGSGPVNAFNLGHPRQTSVDEVADMVIGEMGLSDVKRSYTGGAGGWIGDNPVVLLSLKKMEALGWRPKTPSELAIKKTIRWTLANA